MRELAERRANRIPASLKRRAGEEPYDEDSDRRAREQPWLSQVYAASVSWRVAMGPGQVRPGCRTLLESDAPPWEPKESCW